jgi:hypothetical protein
MEWAAQGLPVVCDRKFCTACTDMFRENACIFERLEAWIGAAEATPIRSEREKKKNEREN